MTPSTCEVVPSFDINVNPVNTNTYDKENDGKVKFNDEVKGNVGADCENSGLQSLNFSIDVDLDI